jgi:hypothetical protein
MRGEAKLRLQTTLLHALLIAAGVNVVVPVLWVMVAADPNIAHDRRLLVHAGMEEL